MFKVYQFIEQCKLNDEKLRLIPKEDTDDMYQEIVILSPADNNIISPDNATDIADNFIKNNKKDTLLFTTKQFEKCSNVNESEEDDSKCDNHIDINSTDSTNVDRNVSCADSTEYICAKCGKCFKHEYFLKRHMHTHLDEKLYECPHCDKSK